MEEINNEYLTEEKKEIFKIYYQENPEYYLKRLERYVNNEKTAFNFKAFLFGVIWAAYRKMYKTVIIFILLVLGVSFIEEILCTYQILPATVYNLLGRFEWVIWSTVFGFITNRIYIAKSIKDVDKIYANYSDIEQRKEKAKQKGGISWFVPIIILIILVLLFMYNIIAS